MELTKKTTILFSPDLHNFLTALAKRRGTSMGELDRRTACENRMAFRSGATSRSGLQTGNIESSCRKPT